MTQPENGAFHGAAALVTGAAGFIGSAVSARLAASGAVVHSVSRRPSGPASAQHH